MWRLRSFDPSGDRGAVERLWRAALDPLWPWLPAAVDVLHSGFVATDGGDPVGFVAVDRRGSVPLLIVAPRHQRRGLGTELLDTATAALDTDEIQLGSGGDDYIWPGVPLDLPAAVRFFTARGWHSVHDVLDLTQDLRDYRGTPGARERAREHGVVTSVATEDCLGEVMAFESGTFPSWARFFEHAAESILIARDAAGGLVGTLLFDGPDAAVRYRPMLGPLAGEIGCVGVAPHAEGRGIGSAMVAHASEILRDRGTRVCHIGWAVRDAFYGRIGYRPWRRYRMFRWPGAR